MLAKQAHTLDAIFNTLARRANNAQYLDKFERYLKPALKAQAQSRSTWEALARIKNPPIAGYVRQANIAHGPQQVNNEAGLLQQVPTKKTRPCKTNYWMSVMTNGWTAERRARQAERIREWQPWTKSTGPKTPAGKARVSRNGDKGGTWRTLRELDHLLKQHRDLID